MSTSTQKLKGTQKRSRRDVEKLEKNGILLIGPHYYYKLNTTDTRLRNVELMDTHKWKYEDSDGIMQPATSLSDLANKLKQELDTNYGGKRSTGENGWRRVYFKDGENKDKSLEIVTRGHREIRKRTMNKNKEKEIVIQEIRRETTNDIITTDTDETKEDDDDDSFKFRKQRMMENHEIRMLQRQHAEEIKQQERKEALQKKQYEIDMKRLEKEDLELIKKMSELQIN